MRTCLAMHLAGDQHIGSTVQYGIDDFKRSIQHLQSRDFEYLPETLVSAPSWRKS